MLFSTTAELEQIHPSVAMRVKRALPCLYYAGLICLILALARPQFGSRRTHVVGNGISIVMCVDRSGSMAAQDFSINGIPVDRLQAVKKTFRDFVQGSSKFKGRPNDLIALVTFGGFVDACCPLTLDHDSLVELLEKIETPRPLYDRNGNVIHTQIIDEEGGTAIGDALATGVDLLKDSPNKTKVVVLLSDGVQTTGALDYIEGIKIAKAYGVKVYAIGAGSSDPAPFPHYLPDGGVVMRRAVLDFDPEALQTIAEATGGKYFYAGDSKALTRVCEEIDNLERTKFTAGVYADYADSYRLLLAIGATLLTLYVALATTRFRSFP